MNRLLSQKLNPKSSTFGVPSTSKRYMRSHVHELKDRKHRDSSFESTSPVFSFPVYDANEQIREDVRTLTRSKVPLHTLRSIGKQLQPRARVKWEFLVKELEERLQKVEDTLVPLLEIKNTENYQEVRTRPRTLTPSAYIPLPPEDESQQNDLPEGLEDFIKDALRGSINHAVDYLRKKESMKTEKESESLWRTALSSFLDDLYKTKVPTDEQRYLDKWNLSSEFLGYKWKVEDFTETLAHWEEAPLVIFPFARGYHYYKFESLAYPFTDYVKTMDDLQTEESISLWKKVAEFEFMEPIRIAEEIAKDSSNFQENNLPTRLKEKIEYCKNELSKLPKYQKPNTNSKWSESLYCGSVREMAGAVFGGAIARAKITGNESLVGSLNQLYQKLLFSDTQKFASILSLTLANNVQLKNFLQHHIIKYFGESLQYTNIFHQFAPKIPRSSEFSLEEEKELVAKTANDLVRFEDIDTEIEKIRNGEKNFDISSALKKLSKEELKEMVKEVEEIEEKGPAQFASQKQPKAERVEDTSEKNRERTVVENSFDDIFVPELEELELKTLGGEKVKYTPLKIPKDKFKEEDIQEALNESINEMEIESLGDNYDILEKKEKIPQTMEEKEAYVEKKLEELILENPSPSEMKKTLDSDYFLLPPVAKPEAPYEFQSEMPAGLESRIMEEDIDSTPDMNGVDLSNVDVEYDFLERSEQQLLETKEPHPTMMLERYGILNLKVGKLFLVQRTSLVTTNRDPQKKIDVGSGVMYAPLPPPVFGDLPEMPYIDEAIENENIDTELPTTDAETETLVKNIRKDADQLRALLDSIRRRMNDKVVPAVEKQGLERLEAILVSLAKRHHIPLAHFSEEESESSESFESVMKSMEMVLKGKDEVLVNNEYFPSSTQKVAEGTEESQAAPEAREGKLEGDKEDTGKEADLKNDSVDSKNENREEGADLKNDSEFDSKNENMEEDYSVDIDPAWAPLMEDLIKMPLDESKETKDERGPETNEAKEDTQPIEANEDTEPIESKEDEEEPTSEAGPVEPIDMDEVIKIYESLSVENPNSAEVKMNLKKLLSFNYLPSKSMNPSLYEEEKLTEEEIQQAREQTIADNEQAISKLEQNHPTDFLESDGPTRMQSQMIDIPPKELLELKKLHWPIDTLSRFTNPLRLILSVDWEKQSLQGIPTEEL